MTAYFSRHASASTPARGKSAGSGDPRACATRSGTKLTRHKRISRLTRYGIGLNIRSGPLRLRSGTMHKVAKHTARKQTSGEVIIPDKIYFRIGEVSRLCGLPSYVLRFWESEFPQLKPPKSSTGQRTYRRPDVENVLRIKRLLYEEGFTIAGARLHLREEVKGKQKALPFAIPPAGRAELKQVRQNLREILGILGGRRSAV